MRSLPAYYRSDGARGKKPQKSCILARCGGKEKIKRLSHTQNNGLRDSDFRGVKGSESLRGGKIVADLEGVRQLRGDGHKAYRQGRDLSLVSGHKH